MGQISSPLSMRYSKSMHWPSLWSDKINHTKKTNVDIFSNMILPLFFNETIYYNKFINTVFSSFYLNSSYLTPSTLKFFYENKFFQKKASFLTLDSLTPFFLSFFGKVWILKFNNWVIFVIYVYSPKKIKVNLKQQTFFISKKNYFFWKLNSTYKVTTSLKSSSLICFY